MIHFPSTDGELIREKDQKEHISYIGLEMVY